MKTRHGIEYEKTIHIKGKIATPVRKKDGSWTVVVEDIEKEIPDLGREDSICNECGWSTYPDCKNWCNAWVYHTRG